MMQVSYAGMKMQSLSMMVLVHIFNCDANVSLRRWRCKNLVVQMLSNGYVMMQMLLCRYAMMQMSFCRNVMMQMPPCRYAMMLMFWCKHNLFKNSLYFQNEASSAPKTKIFSKLDLLFLKSHILFDLRPPQKIGDQC